MQQKKKQNKKKHLRIARNDDVYKRFKLQAKLNKKMCSTVIMNNIV